MLLTTLQLPELISNHALLLNFKIFYLFVCLLIYLFTWFFEKGFLCVALKSILESISDYVFEELDILNLTPSCSSLFLSLIGMATATNLRVLLWLPKDYRFEPEMTFVSVSWLLLTGLQRCGAKTPFQSVQDILSIYVQ